MSGGVDSSVAALLLKRKGYKVSGAYMKNWINEENILGDCPWQKDIEDARAVATQIGIDFHVVNFMKEYKMRVVSYLIEGYRGGSTPNPDVICNREMKFGLFLNYAIKNGFSAIGTGHYCRIVRNKMGKYDLLEGVDKNKDQSYFLSMLKQTQLRHAYFPIGHLNKNKVREIANKEKLPTASKKDSQGICFIGKIEINDFLKNYIPDNIGDIVNSDHKIIGQHLGLHRYTLGQRKGIGLPSNQDHKNYVVIDKDIENNRLIVSFEEPGTVGLFSKKKDIHSLSFCNEPLDKRLRCLAKPRYRDPSQEIIFEPKGNNEAQVLFKKTQRALASGQVVALYHGEKLLGGGIYS